jgi:hypothetical protein
MRDADCANLVWRRDGNSGANCRYFRLSVVIAVQHSEQNLPHLMRAIGPSGHPDVEILVCHVAAEAAIHRLIGKQPGIRLLKAAEGSLIPHLWRNGLLAARGDRVATVTAHCIPADGWVEALLKSDLDAFAGVGGTIANDPAADAKGCAIFLLRYSSFAPPQAKRDAHDLAADNALYRRADLLSHRDLLARGFWEPSFHQRLLAQGQRLCVDPAIQVTHHNRYTAGQFLAQRFAHGTEFGQTRAAGWPLHKTLAMLVLAPAIFGLVLWRVVRRSFGERVLRRQLLASWFWLPVFLAAWVAGEERGYWRSIRTCRIP